MYKICNVFIFFNKYFFCKHLDRQPGDMGAMRVAYAVLGRR